MASKETHSKRGFVSLLWIVASWSTLLFFVTRASLLFGMERVAHGSDLVFTKMRLAATLPEMALRSFGAGLLLALGSVALAAPHNELAVKCADRIGADRHVFLVLLQIIDTHARNDVTFCHVSGSRIVVLLGAAPCYVVISARIRCMFTCSATKSKEIECEVAN